MLKRLVRRSLQSLLRALHPGPSRDVRALEYHYVDETGSSLSVSPTAFRDHLRLIREEGFTSLSADAFAERVSSGKCGAKEVFITFDDGFENFHAHAAPLLAEFGMTATVFVVTDLAGQPPVWLTQDRPAIERFMSRFNLSPEDKRLYDRSMEYFATCRLMTWDQVADVRRLGMDVHSHTASHPFLSQVPKERLTEELSKSRRTLKDRLGVDVDLVCYPYGDCDDAVAAAARDAGYRVGFVSGRLNSERDLFRVGRVPISGSMGTREVSFRLSRAYDAFWKLTRR
jgi:peptidoglycan/xylan/chitin deacetylase (PgdA/CDA1 family)